MNEKYTEKQQKLINYLEKTIKSKKQLPGWNHVAKQIGVSEYIIRIWRKDIKKIKDLIQKIEVNVSKDSKIANQDVKVESIKPYKEEEFKFFISFLKKSYKQDKILIGSWAAMANALGISRKTIERWRNLPEIKKLKRDGLAELMSRLSEFAEDDIEAIKMYMKFYGMDIKERFDLTSGDKPIKTDNMRNSDAIDKLLKMREKVLQKQSEVDE